MEPFLGPDQPVRAQLQDGGDPVGAGVRGTDGHQDHDRVERVFREGATGCEDGRAPEVRQLVDDGGAEAAGRGGRVCEIGDPGGTAGGDPRQ